MRKAFLTDESHRICFMYVPKHTSWQKIKPVIVQ